MGGQNTGSSYKPSPNQSGYVQLWEEQIKSANCNVVNFRVKFICKKCWQHAWSILMKLLKGINMLGNCCLSSFSLKSISINSQLITKCKNAMNKKLSDWRWVGWEIGKCGLFKQKTDIFDTAKTEWFSEGFKTLKKETANLSLKVKLYLRQCSSVNHWLSVQVLCPTLGFPNH